MSEETPDPRLQRVSDAERHQVVEALQRAAGEGRLDVEELEERLEAAWAAKTYADLVPILVDLPDEAPRPSGTVERAGGTVPAARRTAGHPVGPVPEHESSLAVLSEQKRTGVWRVGPAHTASAVLGTVVLDLREAVLEAETTITANTVLGSVEVLVDAETVVVVDGTPLLGEFGPVKDKVAPAVGPDSPVVRIAGMAVLGSVVVKRQRRPGEKRPPRGLKGR